MFAFSWILCYSDMERSLNTAFDLLIKSFISQIFKDYLWDIGGIFFISACNKSTRIMINRNTQRQKGQVRNVNTWSGTFVNPGNTVFAGLAADSMYMDKTGLLQFTNEILGHPEKSRICVSRPRRFGKSTAIHTMSAYYSRACDSRQLFRGLSIESSPSYLCHLNRHNVIVLDIQSLWIESKMENPRSELIPCIEENVLDDLSRFFPGGVSPGDRSLPDVLWKLYEAHGETFIFLIDEWDVIYREDQKGSRAHREYVRFLKDLSSPRMEKCIDMIYLTGILPIQRGDKELSLGSFHNYSMLDPHPLEEYTGFTEEEVKTLCERFQMPFEEMKSCYDGYHFSDRHFVYCPYSVTTAIHHRHCWSYWSQTTSDYILRGTFSSGMPELYEPVGMLITGRSVRADPENFNIEMSSPETLNDVLVSLVHLGYLSYNRDTRSVSIPTREIYEDFYDVLSLVPGHPASEIINNSHLLLVETLDGRSKETAQLIASAHDYYSGSMYNDENALDSSLLLAYHYALEEGYLPFREFPSGKGYADLLLIPKDPDEIPILVELKRRNAADTPICRIRETGHWNRIQGFSRVLLAEVTYEDSGEKDHTCVIETWSLS